MAPLSAAALGVLLAAALSPSGCHGWSAKPPPVVRGVRGAMIAPRSAGDRALRPRMSAAPPSKDAGLSIDLTFLGAATLVGLGTGLAVAAFKTSIAAVAAACYAGDAVMPYAAAAWVGLPSSSRLLEARVTSCGSHRRAISWPGTAVDVAEVEREVPPAARAAAAAPLPSPLGTGCALGPEGPSVEIGVSISRLVGEALPARDRTGGRGSSAAHCGSSASSSPAPPASPRVSTPPRGRLLCLGGRSEAVRAAVLQRRRGAGGGGGGRWRRPRRPRAAQDLAELDVKSSEARRDSHLPSSPPSPSNTSSGGSSRCGRRRTRRRGRSQKALQVGLGGLSGAVALLFAAGASRRLARLERRPPPKPPEPPRPSGGAAVVGLVARPALGGLACGLVGAAFPQALATRPSTPSSPPAMSTYQRPSTTAERPPRRRRRPARSSRPSRTSRAAGSRRPMPSTARRPTSRSSSTSSARN